MRVDQSGATLVRVLISRISWRLGQGFPRGRGERKREKEREREREREKEREGERERERERR
jgi:hypothetical protein